MFPANEEFPVSAGHKPALITSLPFVHTARRYYRLSGSVRASDRSRPGVRAPAPARREDVRTRSLGESKSRNKVSVGEPAEGSLPKNAFSFRPRLRAARTLGWERGELVCLVVAFSVSSRARAVPSRRLRPAVGSRRPPQHATLFRGRPRVGTERVAGAVESSTGPWPPPRFRHRRVPIELLTAKRLKARRALAAARQRRTFFPHNYVSQI